MAVPPCEFGNLLLAVWTESLLFFPEVEQFPSLSEIVFHLQIETFLEVGFPCGVIRVRIFLDLDVPFNWRIRCPSKIHPRRFLFVADLSEKDPISLA